MSVDNLITVGEIVNTQGNKGEVRVWPLTDFPQRFKPDEIIMIEKNGQLRELTIENVRLHKKFVVIKFREIPDMNSAEEIKGGFLKITMDKIMALPDDAYYIFEIVGMDVLLDNGQYLGKVKDVIQTGSNDVYVVEGRNKDYLIPAVRHIVRHIDRNEKKIIISPLEGLLDL